MPLDGRHPPARDLNREMRRAGPPDETRRDAEHNEMKGRYRHRPRPATRALPRPRPTVMVSLAGTPRARIVAGDLGEELELRGLAAEIEALARHHLAALRARGAAA